MAAKHLRALLLCMALVTSTRAAAAPNLLTLEGPIAARYGSDVVYVLRAPNGLQNVASVQLHPTLPVLGDRELAPPVDTPMYVAATVPSAFTRQYLMPSPDGLPPDPVTTPKHAVLAFCAVHVSADAFPGTTVPVGVDYRLLDPEGHAVGAGTATKDVQVLADLPPRTDLSQAESVEAGDYEVGPGQSFDVQVTVGESFASACFAYVRLSYETPDPPAPQLSLVAAWGRDPSRDWVRQPRGFVSSQNTFWGPQDPFEGATSVRNTLVASAPFAFGGAGTLLTLRMTSPDTQDVQLYRLRVDAALFDADGNPMPVRTGDGSVRVDPSLPRGQAVRFIYGDVDGDGRVGVSDTTRVIRAVAGLITLTPDQMRAADVYPVPGIGGRTAGDGVINLSDALAILRRALGLESGYILKG